MANDWEEFARLAINYYVAGRFSAAATLHPTAGNLVDHAVEMALKAALSKKGMRLEELKNLNHELPKIWRTFKENYGADPGTNFDAIVSNLHRFEEIRYPQFNPPPTMSTIIGIGKPGNATTPAPHPGEKRYELRLGEIDELMGQIFTVASINPKAFTSGLFPLARTHLTAENEEAPWQLS